VHTCQIERVIIIPECMKAMGGIQMDHEWMNDRGGVEVRGHTYISDRECDNDMGQISILHWKATIQPGPQVCCWLSGVV